MRARLSGSTITAHGDNLGTPYVEFYGNEPLGFSTNWTVSGSSPNRVLVNPSGHEFSRELPTQTVASGGGGGSISATDGTTTVSPATSIVFPSGTLSDAGGGVASMGLLLQRVGPFSIAFDTVNISSRVALAPLPSGCSVIRAWAEVTTTWNNAGIFIGAGGSTAISGGDWWTVAEYATGAHAPQSDAGAVAELGFVNNPTTVVRLLNAGFLVAQVSGGPTTGAANVYAIIATPAS